MVERGADQGILHGENHAQRGTYRRNFLHRERKGNFVHSAATLTGRDGHSEQPELRHPSGQFPGKPAGIRLGGARGGLALAKIANHPADHALLFG
jgi:hypothetical protein